MNQSILVLIMSLSVASPVQAGEYSDEVHQYAIANMATLLNSDHHEQKGRLIGCMFSNGFMRGLDSSKTVEEAAADASFIAPLVLDAMVQCYQLAVSK